MLYYCAKYRIVTLTVTKETVSKIKVQLREMARFSLGDVLASVLNSDDENDEFGLLDSSSKNEEGQESSEVVVYSGESQLA